MNIKPTTRIVPFDMDGNHLAVHHGYDEDFTSTEAVFAAYPAAAGITLTPKGGLQRIVRRAVDHLQ